MSLASLGILIFICPSVCNNDFQMEIVDLLIRKIDIIRFVVLDFFFFFA